jgi:sugar lactone lactonase YvrE
MIHSNKIQPLMLGLVAFILVGCGSGNSENTGSSAANLSSVISSAVVSSSVSISSSVSSSNSSSLSSSISSSISSSESSSSLSSSSESSSSVYTVATFASAAALNGDGLTIDKDGNIFVGTSKGHTVNKITPGGQVSLFATFAAGSANGSDIDSQGNLFVANVSSGIIHKVTPNGEVSDYLTDLNGPAGIYIDDQDNLIVGLYGKGSTAGAEVLKIAPDKTITTFVKGNGLTNVVGVTGDGQGRYFAANFLTGEIYEITGGIVRQIGAAGTRVNHMKYAKGYIYMPNPFDHLVRRMDLNGNFELIAGIKSQAGSVNGSSQVATFARPNSVDISPDGKTLYILDFNTGDVRSILME